MTRDEHDDFCVGVIGRRPIECTPQVIACTCPCRADIGMAIMGIYPPSGDGAIGVAVFARPADMIHDAVFTLGAACAHFFCDFVERLVP